jgi:hypothetical protein
LCHRYNVKYYVFYAKVSQVLPSSLCGRKVFWRVEPNNTYMEKEQPPFKLTVSYYWFTLRPTNRFFPAVCCMGKAWGLI